MHKHIQPPLLALIISIPFHSFANDSELDLSTMYQDEFTKEIFTQDGQVFRSVGKYQTIDKHGNYIYKDCSETDFYGDPSVTPPEDAILPGPECELIEVSGDAIIKIDKSVRDDMDNLDDRSCQRWGGYAPPLTWSPWSVIANHVGWTVYNISVTIHGDTRVDSKVRYYNNRWHENNFNGAINILTSNDVADVSTSHYGSPFGSSVVIMIC